MSKAEPSAAKAAKSKHPITDKANEGKHKGPCDDKNRCPAMRAALIADTGKVGLQSTALFNRKTSTVRSVITYRLGRSETLMVEFCPWCGTKLQAEGKAA